jgi:hypothetical protein
VVTFAGTSFGGIEENTAYYVLAVISATQFTITATLGSTTPVTLTTATGVMTARFFDKVSYRVIAGRLPSGVQANSNGLVQGVPQATASLRGVPTEVATDVTSKFTIRAFTETVNNGSTVITGLADRTFTLTVTGNDVPEFVTPAGSLGTFYDGAEVDITIQYTNTDPGDTVLVRLVGGELPLGLRLTPAGRIFGYIRPFPDEDQPPGYDLTAIATVPYDFLSAAISKNYQFTLEITDGKASNLRTFTIFVYNRQELTADATTITGDNTFITADETTERAPFLANAEPSNIGTYRGDNYFAYRFVGEDYDDNQLEYALSVNQGFGLPPGLQLDRYTGWYYGFIPDVEITETTYSFFVQVRARSLVCTATTSGTNVITCDTSTRGDFYEGAAVTFEGTVFGGLSADTTYYVLDIISDTEFTVSASIAGPEFALVTASGTMFCVPEDISASQLYPFTITITGAIDREVTWLTDPDLGTIENGATSLLRVEAVNRGGTPLFYQLKSGAFNELPQGLQLLPSGDIAGRVSFNTFAIDNGATTFDVSQSTVTGLDPTTFDSTFVFTVNAFAEDPQQPLFKVSTVRVLVGGSGFSSAPSIVFNAPEGADAVQATATVTVAGGAITAVNVTNSGANYTSVATFTLTGVGSGAQLEVVMQPTGVRRIISNDREFTLRLVRAYDRPYQNLLIQAMPSQSDREILRDLLDDQEIFQPEFIFRPDDPNFGISRSVIYEHAVGLAPEILDDYVRSLNLNHYTKNLVLGDIRTAQAVDDAGNVIYEVVYSAIIDDLVNNEGDSVGKVVALPYQIIDPSDQSTELSVVYPNSLINMRDQVIDVVGQISTKLPLWMTSKQADGRVLGFTPAWVICYANPGRSEQIAYYISQRFQNTLNVIDFTVDRYILDAALSRNWDAATQSWTPTPSLTTFDRISTTGYADLGIVQACTELAFADVNNRDLAYINARGGLDGATWISVSGQSPPSGTRVIIRNGSKIIFVKQEAFNEYVTAADAFTQNIGTFDEGVIPGDIGSFDAGSVTGALGSFDYGLEVPGGYTSTCSATSAVTDRITCVSTLGMVLGDKIWFTGSVFGNIADQTGAGLTQLYFVYDILSVTATATASATDRITVSSTADLTVGDEIWFPSGTLGGIAATTAAGLPIPYYVIGIPTANQIEISASPAGTPLNLNDSVGSITIYLPQFQVATALTPTQPVSLATASGTMTANYGNQRMSIWTVSVGVDEVITLTQDTETITNDYVTSSQGLRYAAGTYLYRPAEPGQNLTRVSWLPLITATTVVTSETTFDENSLQFTEPVDMYDPGDQYDKYLVFPKQNILV